MSDEFLRPYVRISEPKYPRVYLDVPSFLASRVVRRCEELRDCDFVFLGVPWEGAVTWGSWSGCQLAPMHVRRASLRYGGFIPEFGVDILSEVRLCDFGDVAVDPQDRERTFHKITESVSRVLEAGATPIVVGGDHSITYPILKAFTSKGFKPTVLHFDAHYDNLPSFDGDRYARCCPIRRVIEDLNIPPSKVFHIGIRGPRNARASKEYADSVGANVYTMWRLREEGFTELVSRAVEEGKDSDGVYVTICMDVLDPSSAPAGAGDPMGFTTYELLSTLTKVVKEAPLLGMDVVELYPLMDVREMTSHLAVWIIMYTIAATLNRS